jgi:hypothetical protein
MVPSTLMVVPNRDLTAEYHILIHAQNGGSTEELYLRPSKRGVNWEFKVEVWKEKNSSKI